MRRCLWMLLSILACISGESGLMGGHLDNNTKAKSRSGKIESLSTLGHKTHLNDLDLDLTAKESTIGTDVVVVAEASSTSIGNDAPRYHVPYPFAFNGGKPFSLEKDPITGKINFEKAPPVRVLNYTIRNKSYQEHEDKGNRNDSEEITSEKDAYSEQEKIQGNIIPNEINMRTSNFHDFLNLPIHYSSDKYENDKYPLISSSYANTKVQSGANSYSTYNHRPYHIESDLYARLTKNPYASMIKTSMHRTTIINDFKAKWTNGTTSLSTITTSTPPTITNQSKVMLSTSTKAPIITTWKPSTSIALLSINRTRMEEDEKNILPIEKLHASSHIGAYQNSGNVPVQSSKDGTTEEIQDAITHYKNQPNINNFVLSHIAAEMKPSTQNEEYGDSYDFYETSDDENDTNGSNHSDGESESNSEDSDYFLLPFRDLSKNNITRMTPASPTSSVILTTTVISNVTESSTETMSAAVTIVPSRSASSTLLTLQEDVSMNLPRFPMMSQRPVTSLPLNSDQRQDVIEHYDGISHEYKPTSMTKLNQDKMNGEIVIESTSNIVIPPDQNTVSFILGNRQNVDGGYYSVDTTIGKNSYDTLSDIDTSFRPLRNNTHSPTKEVKYSHPIVSVVEPNSDRITQKWWPYNSSALKSNNELEQTRFQSLPVTASGIGIEDMRNQSKEKNSNYITLSDAKAKNKEMTEEHIIIRNKMDGSIRELPPKTTMMTKKTTTVMNKTKIVNLSIDSINGDLPQLAENLMPPTENSRPSSHYYHYQHITLRPDHSRPQRLPLPSRIKPHPGHSVSALDVALRKRPYPLDTKLPNILPQFRPNAKASHDHRFGSDVIGTMSGGQGLPMRIRQPLQNYSSSRKSFPPPPPPSYLQCLNPPPPPIHAVRLAFIPTSKVNSVALSHETEPTIQRYHPLHASSISREGLEENVLSNRVFSHGTGQSNSEEGGEGDSESKKQNQIKSEIMDERENESSGRYPEEPPMTPPKPPLFPKHRMADPPHVTTLQMIQHHGELSENEAQLVTPLEPVLTHQAEHRKSNNNPTEIVEQPVYVVYPVNTAVNIHPDDSKEKDSSVVVGTRGSQRPLPPDTLLQDEREKVHTVYNSRPIALNFPYSLERPSSIFPVSDVKETPLLIPSDQRQQIFATSERENGKYEQDTINVIPYLQDFLPYQKKNEAAISVTLHRTAPMSTSASVSTSTSTLMSISPMSTSTPIAYVYTPTHTAAHHLDDLVEDAANAATAPILLPSQQPSSSSSSAPAPQNFMAPFVASMSAEAPMKNGWSVVIVEPPSAVDKRLDSNSDDAKLVDPEVNMQTEKEEFDAENFKPQLFGGFKPIYEFPTEDMQHHDVANTNAETDISRRSKELSVPDKG